MGKVCIGLIGLCLFTILGSAQITVENDSSFLKQKALFEMLGVLEAWKVTRGSPEVIIGCIDNGFDFYHPYLHNQLIPGYYAEGGYHPMTFQTMGHGTLVSSIMVANPKNKNGMHGLAPECKVLTASLGSIEHLFRAGQELMKKHPDMLMKDMLKELRKDSIGMNQFAEKWNEYIGASIAKSIVYLVDKGVRLINISSEFINSPYSQSTKEKLNQALDYAAKQDVLLIIAAGNKNIEITSTLNMGNHILMVGASTQKEMRWTFTYGDVTQGSNWGELLDVCAPSEGLVVCQPADKRYYQTVDGPMGAEDVPYNGNICDVMPMGSTSNAAPIVSALAALIYSISPRMKAIEVKQMILEGCEDIGDKGVDLYTGYGRIHFGKTIELAVNYMKR